MTDGEPPEAVLEGFTITDCYAEFGAGVYIYGASPTIVRCLIAGNRSSPDLGQGGGIAKVVAASGRLVQVLVDAELAVGRHDLRWRPSSSNVGRELPSGVYFLSVDTREGRESRAFVVVR